MTKLHRAIAAALIAGIAFQAEASKFKRSTAARNHFQKANPCPATGKPKGACPGYVIDHIVPLCAGGADKPENMQWQTIAEAREKDRVLVAKCRPKGPGYRGGK